jgi:hypothetical protein
VAETLLREAIAIEPAGDYSSAARVALFRQEMGLDNDALALAAIDPIRSVLEAPAESSTATDQQSTETAAEVVDTLNSTSATSQSQPALWISNADRAALLAQVAAAAWQQGDPTRSISDLQLALDLVGDTPAAAQTVAWKHRLAVVRRAQEREAGDMSRRPLVSAQLTQSNSVRPRVSTASEAP